MKEKQELLEERKIEANDKEKENEEKEEGNQAQDRQST